MKFTTLIFLVNDVLVCIQQVAYSITHCIVYSQCYSEDLESRLSHQESSSSKRIAELESQISRERDKAYHKMEDQLRTVCVPPPLPQDS